MIKKDTGFTLMEVVIIMGVMTFVAVGMFQLFVQIGRLSDITENKTAAVTEAQTKIEEIRNTSYALIPTLYGSGGMGQYFDLSLLNGKGTVCLDASDAELLKIQVDIHWRDQIGRIYGEDRNLNGILDTSPLGVSEDTNNNGCLDSIVTLQTMITRR